MVVILGGVLSSGCTPRSGDAGGDAGGDARAGEAAESGSEPEPPRGGESDAIAEPFVPSEPLPKMTVLKQGGSCPELPKLYDDSTDDRRDAYELARVLRELACEPELHTLATSEASTKLRVPEWMTIALYEGGARIESKRHPPAADMARSLGVEKPVARLEWQAYHDQWYLGSEASGNIDGYGPGSITVMLSGDADHSDPPGKKVPVTAETQLRGVYLVGMPDTAVKMEADPEGVKQVVTAVKLLGADAESLRKEPEAVAEMMKLGTERWRVSRTTSMGGDSTTSGISISPQRTHIPADEFAAQLDLKEAKAYCVNQEHDVWDIQAGGTTQIPIGDAVLSVNVEPANKDGLHTTLEGSTVEFISLLPKTPDE